MAELWNIRAGAAPAAMCPTSRSPLQPRLVLPRALIRDHSAGPSDHWTYHVVCEAVDEHGQRHSIYSGPAQCSVTNEYKQEQQLHVAELDSYQDPAVEATTISCDFLESFLYQSNEVDGIHLESFDFDATAPICQVGDSSQVAESCFTDSHAYDGQPVVLTHLKHYNDPNNNELPSVADNVDKLTSEFLAQLPDDIVYKDLESLTLEYTTDHDALVEILSTDKPFSGERPTILFFEENTDYGHNLKYVDPETCRAMNDEVDNYMDESLDHISIPDCPPSKPKGKHPCSSCDETFTSLLKLRSHSRTRHNEQSSMATPEDSENFYCAKCQRKFSYRERWQSHMQAHSVPELECTKCSKVLGSKASLKAHQRIHSRKFSCEHCARTYETEAQLKMHASKKHSVFGCDKCEFTCRDREECNAHKEVHCSINDIRLVDEFIMDESFLKQGMPVHENNDELVNGIVEENVGLVVVSNVPREELENDVINLRQSDDLMPEFCTEKDYFDAEDLSDDNFGSSSIHTSTSKELDSAYKVVSNIMQTETRNKHAKVKNKLVRDCTECEKHFDRGSDFKRHAIEHVVQETYRANHCTSGVSVFRCQLCEGGRFSRVDKLKAHLRHHLKLRLYQCDRCNKTFSDSSNYSKHKKVHGAADVYQCDTCKRKFNTKKMISQHMDYHNKTEPLHCAVCGKEYYFQSNLKKHVNVHHKSKGNGSFSCHSCRMRFPSMRLKWDHQWAEHGIRKNVNDCGKCRAKFRKCSELKRHLRDKH